MHRRTATKVVGGRVRKKNNHALDRRDYLTRRQDEIRLDRKPPGEGFRHLVTLNQLRDFLPLLPDWDQLAVGLDAIVLDEGEPSLRWMGWWQEGVVAVNAWPRDLWISGGYRSWYEEHQVYFDALGVEYDAGPDWEVRWTEEQARAYQLLVVLPHEMGHHHDDLAGTDGGEPYAERYEREVFDALWPREAAWFGL